MEGKGGDEEMGGNAFPGTRAGAPPPPINPLPSPAAESPTHAPRSGPGCARGGGPGPGPC